MKEKKQIKVLSVSSGKFSHIEVSLFYTLGKSKFDRGLYILAEAVPKKESSGGFIYVMRCVRRMGRFDTKVFEKFNVSNHWVSFCVDELVRKNNIKLTKKSEIELNKF